MSNLSMGRSPLVLLAYPSIEHFAVESGCFASMEFSSSSSSFHSLSHWDYLGLLIFRPVLAILFVISFVSIGWFMAWKLVLVHVPLVQEIFSLRKKPTKPKPLTRRISRIYDSIDARNSTPAGINSSGLSAD